MNKPKAKDKATLEDLEKKLSDLRSKAALKRDITLAITSEGFMKTGNIIITIEFYQLYLFA